MIVIVTALYSEAKPWIAHYQLKPSPGAVPFPLFANFSAKSPMTLVVSGTGAIAAAAATAYVLGRQHSPDDTALFNIGICGARNSRFAAGEAVLIHKIRHHETDAVYYPDILFRHPFRESALETFSRPVDASMAEGVREELVDMEAAGYFAAASRFLPPHRIFVIKIVADRLEPGSLSAKRVSELVTGALPVVGEWVERCQHMFPRQSPVLSPEETERIERIGGRLRLSATMRHQLKQWAIQYKIRTGQPFPPFDDLLAAEVTSKTERRSLFDELRRRFLYE
jgi:hypothetical protein